MKKLISFICLCSFISYGQTITVDSNSYSASDLANLLVTNSCITPTNISYSSGQSVAYFNKNGSAFPITQGVVIRNGIAQHSEGTYTGNNLSSQVNSNSDVDLQNLSNSSGQTSTITDAAYLEFDFIPISNNFNFRFLFASNEYGEFQCGFSDVFAFLLTDLTTGVTTNIAVVPGTSTPISVKDIRNNAYNSSCSSVNPSLFNIYNVNNPAVSSLNMRGFTQVLNASATTIPNNPYRIKLVIGDYNDADYDSAVFVSAGSFNSTINLGPDSSLCLGNNTSITSGLDATEYSHTWSLNGVVISSETNNTLNITQAGTYKVTVVKAGTTCQLTDTIVFTDLQVNPPQDLYLCNNGTNNYTFDLTQNNATALGINSSQYQIFYYNSIANVNANNSIPSSSLNTYASSGNETIYIKLFNISNNTFCSAQYSFDLLVNSPVIANQPNNINLCNNAASLTIDLTTQNSQILNGQSSNNLTITYFNSEVNATNNTNATSSSATITSATSPRTIWVRVESTSNSSCFAVTSFQIIVNPLPQVDSIPEVIACENFTLPALTNGAYYTGPNGSGNQLNANDIIDETGTYYIYNGPDANGCTNQTSFLATFMDEYEIDLEHCGQFVVPKPKAGDFYSDTGGPSGTGVLIPEGTVITTNQTIYFYVAFNGVFCREEAYPLIIHILPPVDSLNDVITCGSYTLQPISNGNYFTETNGGGTPLFAGNTLTTTDTIYIFADNGTCTNETSFYVAILNQPTPKVVCGSYTLPALIVGNYYTQIGGQGTIIPAGTVITSSQTIYIFANTTSTPNCTSTFTLPITIKPKPVVDDLNDEIRCANNPFELPVLSGGNYYTATNGGGTMLNAGDIISTTQTIYIYDILNGCSDQTSFNVEIVPLPQVENFTDIFSCNPFVLPNLIHGTYYTEPAGNGNIIPNGTAITTTQVIYIFNEALDANGCYAETLFQVNYLGVEVGTFNDITECDTFTLPALTIGNYFWQTGGIDPISTLDFTFNTPGTYTIYVYAQNGGRFFCSDEDSFTITISETPVLPSFSDVIKCGTYTLPPLDNSSYNVNYYLSQNGTDIINLADYSINTPGTYTIYVYGTAFNNVNCNDETSFTLTIYPLLDLDLQEAFMCVNPLTNDVIQPAFIDTNLNPSLFTVNWYFNNNLIHTGPSYNATQIGTYTIETIKLTPDSGSNCNYNTTTVLVSQSSYAVAEAIVSTDFDDSASITINILNGYGEYEYQLDNIGGFQSNNVFYNVSSGEHIIYVRDILGNCNDIFVTATVLKYPKYFTPNGDGYNDTWNIWDLRNSTNAVISVFDRYGKFIKQFKTSGFGWDGKLDGYDLPATDYWFVVNYFNENGEAREFKSHFAMKR
ncbi:choice-of-anchor L domain-containing protein [uncultured Flavobacterium sp.]|uniref:T9SS type B sorting domain-containing protein n=1 Tax=uncultured Flavobacterium sp. TaxID=165435 RepID=UPI0030EC5037|tara:strand:- start:71348 stop:75421 length:4074 start_codon:yes stop_codon:yes gene_type:complete